MIVYDLSCDTGHRFEGWFGSSDDYARQQMRGLVTCPECGSGVVGKAPMAPAVGRKGNQRTGAASPGTDAAVPAGPVARPGAARGTPALEHVSGRLPPQVVEAMRQLAQAQAQSLRDSTWVGRDFADASRAMFYGEREAALIHGEASLAEARSLLEEGVPVAPLLVPVARPDELN